MPMDHTAENEKELLPEIVVDEAAEDYVVMEEGEEEEAEVAASPQREESVVLETELPPAPEQVSGPCSRSTPWASTTCASLRSRFVPPAAPAHASLRLAPTRSQPH